MHNFKAFEWGADKETTVVGDDVDASEVRLLRAQVEYLQARLLGLEQDRLADACTIDRQAIQIQILRTDMTSLRARVAELEAGR